ncbi:hypothetical protein HFP72_25540 [Nocardiopsis sp. ARC36]
MRVELAELRAGTEVLRQEALGKIERYAEESERLEELAERSAEAAERADAAGERGEEARIAAARQAAAVYMGADVGPVHAWGGSEGPSGMLERGALLHVLGEHRAAELDRAGAARVVADTVDGLAETAEREQAEAVEAAAAAREEAVQAVTAQEERTAWLLEEQTRLEARLAEVGDAGAGSGAVRRPCATRARRCHPPMETTVNGTMSAMTETAGKRGNRPPRTRGAREGRPRPMPTAACRSRCCAPSPSPANGCGPTPPRPS